MQLLQPVLLNRKGLSLVEVLVALVVLLLVSLALMQTALVSIESNMKNVLRDEAVSIADQRMNDVKSVPFAALVSDASPMQHHNSDGSLGANVTSSECPAVFNSAPISMKGVYVERNFRNMANVGYCTNATVSNPDSNTWQIMVTVGWKWKGEDYIHTYTSIVGN